MRRLAVASLPSNRTMAPSSARVSLTGDSGVPPHALAALISGAYFSAPLVPIAFL